MLGLRLDSQLKNQKNRKVGINSGGEMSRQFEQNQVLTVEEKKADSECQAY